MNPPSASKTTQQLLGRGVGVRQKTSPVFVSENTQNSWDRLRETYLQKSDQKEPCKDGSKGQTWQC